MLNSESPVKVTTPQVAANNPLKDHDYFQTKPKIKRPRQNTSVTDKSQWIMGDDQIDSVLSEHLEESDQRPREKRQRIIKEQDSAFIQYTSSDYSSSDAESDQASECDSEDDPNKLWCICRKPHEDKFMICCDICLDWFHGHCVGVTKLMGDRFDKQGKEWFCGECQEKLRAGISRNAIQKKREVKKDEKKKKKSLPVPGKRGRGRPRKSETMAREGATRVSQRMTRKSSSSLDPKLGVDNGRLKRNLARSDARSESFDEFEDSQRLKELIKERKKEFFYKRHLAEQQKAAKRSELGLNRQSLTANLSDSLDSLATSTSTPNMSNLPINIKSERRERSKPNIVLQINTKKESGVDQGNPTSRIVTTIVRSPKKSKHTESSIDPIVNDLFTADPIQISKKVKPASSTNETSDTSTTGNQTAASSEATTSNGESNIRKRSNSGSSSKNDKSPADQAEATTTPKKKRKDSESSTPNGSTTPIGSKHIAQKIKETLETRSKQIKDLEVASDKLEQLATEIEDQLNECFKEGTQKYLNKFRSLVFNLRDSRNQNLVKNVLTGEITPSRLVRMSPDEMASHELAKWRERENKHSIELIKRDAQLAAQQVIVKKTHKGEEVISAPSFNEPDDPSAEVDNQELPTTPNKQQTTPAEEPRAHGSTITLTPPPVVGNSAGLLKMKITSITESSSPKAEPQHIISNEPCWSGSITMPDIAKFSALAKPVSGAVDFMGDEFNQNLVVCGRIAPDQVQGYIKELKSKTKNQIMIIQLFPLTEDDRNNFDTFFDYLYSRNRYGVIQTSQQILKDFYVLPIHERSSIPEILEPIKGPGIDRKEPNCLLGLLVRSKRSTPPASTYTPTPIK